MQKKTKTRPIHFLFNIKQLSQVRAVLNNVCRGGVGEEGCAHECSARIGQKSVLHLLGLELQVVVSQLMWILECKRGSSERGIYAPNC